MRRLTTVLCSSKPSIVGGLMLAVEAASSLSASTHAFASSVPTVDRHLASFSAKVARLLEVSVRISARNR